LARKVLSLPSLREKERVKREVLAIQKLCGQGAHRNIVQVVDHGLIWNYGYYYIDMELCDMSLNDYLHPKLPPDPSASLPCFIEGGGSNSLIQMWTIMSQIASGLEYIHRKGHVHRDIKPANGSASLFYD